MSRHETPITALQARADALNADYRYHSAIAVLARALHDPDVGQLALVSSFGAESVVLLHMVALARRDTPVIFLETGMLFTETLIYQQELAERLGLRDMRVIRPDTAEIKARDSTGQLNQSDPDACCALRKTVPLARALSGFEGWITGRKRYQGAARADLEFFEVEEPNGEHAGRLKVNPLAHWQPGDARTYIEENRLPRHPLVAQGYPSIGCMPCTSPVQDGEDERAGRWKGQDKTECGIHLVDGKFVKQGESA
ncbi:phosphoadenylylsulfate reductase (thioredoxin) [Roseovarius nanhaiticus]|uniref:Adenosine 5'-phosphosulfate reductase n=1 Tax=Roseovarius nanhaiticus TaxID=573024 RepID=A0A1N7GFL1_9RHOB|nr:phosphoadenylyl-sulfate reductase [Roseovarius nanhaiticus]SEK27716.1 phosphoadenylylsulfate reductase (thioredoxin) [Roseovarius nanhaiticus]SIS11286.1 phosphoadenylylsulfate reductase (thioredoxin) [Roseovarius nanhaiticus]